MFQGEHPSLVMILERRIRPLYVPSPTNDQIERSAVFRVTGACYFWQFTLFDADPNGQTYLTTLLISLSNFSHHKLTCFEYADGKNGVTIDESISKHSSQIEQTWICIIKKLVLHTDLQVEEIFHPTIHRSN